jgi:membrane-associated protease RseP (regulator of RpoE activity)
VIFILEAFVIANLLSLIHLGTTVCIGRLAGVKILEFSFGIGPQVFAIGKLRVYLIAFGGSVRFKSSKDEAANYETLDDAIDRQPLWKQCLIALSGTTLVFGIALVIMGRSAGPSSLAAFEQFVRGAMGPLTSAQEYISNYRDVLQRQGVVEAVGLLAAKLTALNLFQCVIFLLQITTARIPAVLAVVEKFVVLAMLLLMGMMFCWFIAVVTFGWRSL